VVGSFLLMAMVYSQKQTSPTQLVAYMALGDCMLSITLAVGASISLFSDVGHLDSNIYCGISFFFLHVGIQIGALYYFVITLNIYLILRGWTDTKLRKLRLYQHFFCLDLCFMYHLPSNN